MKSIFEREAESIQKLNFLVDDFEYQLGKAAVEVIMAECGNELGYLERPEVLAPEDVTEFSLMERDGELEDWKFVVKKILDLIHQRLIESVNEIEAFEPGTF